jgi:hypothetical protein
MIIILSNGFCPRSYLVTLLDLNVLSNECITAVSVTIFQLQYKRKGKKVIRISVYLKDRLFAWDFLNINSNVTIKLLIAYYVAYA